MTTEEFETEVGRLRPRLTETALRLLKDHQEAEDVVQDALLRLWQMRERLRMPVDALAAVLTRNLCISRLRQRKPTVDIGETSLQDESSEQHERIERMMSVVEQLPELPQLILRLHHMEGMKTRDIAELTQMSEAAVRKALSRARMAVREMYLRDKR